MNPELAVAIVNLIPFMFVVWVMIFVAVPKAAVVILVAGVIGSAVWLGLTSAIALFLLLFVMAIGGFVAGRAWP